MSKPPIGKSQIIQLLFSRYCVTQSSAIKKKADAEPVVMPIKTLMRIHLSEPSSIFVTFSMFITLTKGEFMQKYYNPSWINYFLATTAVNSISTKYSGAIS